MGRKRIDLSIFKTKEVLFSFLEEHGSKIGGVLMQDGKIWAYYFFCPYHKERHASCFVNDRPRYPNWGFKCYGCRRGGDIFDLAALLYGVEMHTAIRLIRKKYAHIEHQAERHNPAQLKISFS